MDEQERERVIEAQRILEGAEPYRGDWLYFGRNRDQIELQAREILRAAGLLGETEMLGQYDDSEIIETLPGIDEYIQENYDTNYYDYYDWSPFLADIDFGVDSGEVIETMPGIDESIQSGYEENFADYYRWTDEALGLDTSAMYERTDSIVEAQMMEATSDLSWYDEIIAGKVSQLPTNEEIAEEIGIFDQGLFGFMESGIPKQESTASKIASTVAKTATGMSMSPSSGGSSQVPKSSASSGTDTVTKTLMAGIAALLGQKTGVNAGSTNPYLNAAVGVGSKIAGSIWDKAGGTAVTAAKLQTQSIVGSVLPWAVVGGLAYFLFRNKQ